MILVGGTGPTENKLGHWPHPGKQASPSVPPHCTPTAQAGCWVSIRAPHLFKLPSGGGALKGRCREGHAAAAAAPVSAARARPCFHMLPGNLGMHIHVHMLYICICVLVKTRRPSLRHRNPSDPYPMERTVDPYGMDR